MMTDELALVRFLLAPSTHRLKKPQVFEEERDSVLDLRSRHVARATGDEELHRVGS